LAEVVSVVEGSGVSVNGSISTAFGCPFEGAVAPARVLGFVERYLELGMDRVTLADTTGMAHPRQVAALTREVLARFPARILLDHKLMPLEESPDGVMVITSRVFDTHGLDELRLATGIEVRPVLAPAAEIDRFTRKYLGVGADTLQSMGVNNDEVTVLEDRNEDDLDLLVGPAAHELIIPDHFIQWKRDILLRLKGDNPLDFFLAERRQLHEARENRLLGDRVGHPPALNLQFRQHL